MIINQIDMLFISLDTMVFLLLNILQGQGFH